MQLTHDSLYYKTFNRSPVPKSILSFPEAKLIEVNDAFLQMIDLPKDEVVGKVVYDLQIWPDVKTLDIISKLMAAQQCSYGQEIYIRSAKGNVTSGILLIEALDDSKNHYILWTIIDISQTKCHENNLRKSEERFRMAMDATSDGLWDRNLITGEVYRGNNWFEMLGYDPREMGSWWVELIHPDDRKSALRALQGHIDGKTERYVAEMRLRKKNGEYIWVLAKGKVTEWDNDGKAIRMVGTNSDISERKRAESENSTP